ncbi:MAG: LysM peptidoglycan-binding domain-containing protein [Lachnospiraceae bacterium]|nr:LysM peptidoglycan-binding domain-containing protein [Lachnospiraceae bacterium]
MSISHNQLWLSIDNDDGSIKEGFQIPYNPDSYKVVEGTNERTVNIAGLGAVTVKSGKSPMTLTFSSFFPLNVEPGIELDDESALKSPKEYDAMLRKWKNGSEPIHLLITNTNINAYFSISTYTAEEEGGDVGKIQYTLSMKQYGTASGSDSANGTATGGGLVRRIDIDPYNLPSVPDTYVVQKKDTLQSIAKYFYNDISMAYEIYKLNTDLLKKGVNTKLKKKWVLYLPHPNS